MKIVVILSFFQKSFNLFIFFILFNFPTYAKTFAQSNFHEINPHGSIPNSTLIKELQEGAHSTLEPLHDENKHQHRSIQYFSEDNMNIVQKQNQNISSARISPSKKETNERFANITSSSLVALPEVHDDNVVDMSSLTDDLEDWEAPLFFRQNYPYYLAGYDDEDRPIWVAEMGKYDARPLFENDGNNIRVLEQYAKQGVYRVMKSIRERSTPERNVTEAFYMVDLDGLSLFHLAHTPSIVLANKIGRKYSKLLEEHFGGAIIINANYLANVLLNTVKPVYGRVMEKVEIYGTQQAKWMPALRRLFPPQSIPTWYGGKSDFKPVKIYG